MNVAAELKRRGIPDALIATALVDGKPIALTTAPHKLDGLNKTEARYAAELDYLIRKGVVVEWRFEAIKLRLAKKCFFCPDFFVRFSNGRLRFVEIKGFLRDDASIKFKLAREQYAWAEWSMLRYVRGCWESVNI